jgi:hypothetical protein
MEQLLVHNLYLEIMMLVVMVNHNFKLLVQIHKIQQLILLELSVEVKLFYKLRVIIMHLLQTN